MTAVPRRLPPHLQTPGLAIADSGCRNSVGGRLRHDSFQEELKSMGVPWQSTKKHEVYRRSFWSWSTSGES